MNTAELKSIVEKVARWADERPYIGRITLFGSLFRDDHHKASDLDVFMEVNHLRTASDQDREDWRQQQLTDFESLNSQFRFSLDIITEVPPDRARQTRGFIERGTPLPDLNVGKVYCVSTTKKTIR